MVETSQKYILVESDFRGKNGVAYKVSADDVCNINAVVCVSLEEAQTLYAWKKELFVSWIHHP